MRHIVLQIARGLFSSPCAWYDSRHTNPVAFCSVRHLCLQSERSSAFFAVKHVAHRIAPRSIQFGVAAAESGAGRVGFFRLAARRAPVREARFVRLQLKFISANGANSDRKGHGSILERSAVKSVRIKPPEPGYGAAQIKCNRPRNVPVPQLGESAIDHARHQRDGRPGGSRLCVRESRSGRRYRRLRSHCPSLARPAREYGLALLP